MKFSLGTGDPGVRRYIQLRREMVPKCMRLFMIEFYRDCTLSTPVDTGRARWGWMCSIGRPALSAPPPGQYSMAAARAADTFTVSAVSGRDPLYVANNVPYIHRLNEGWSKQAPARFVELAFDAAFDKLQKYITAHGYDRD